MRRGTVIGQKTAAVTLIQFEDLACTHCNDYENHAKLNELATDKGVRRLARGTPGLNANELILDAQSISVREHAAAHAVEADRREVPGTPWFFIRVGNDPPKLVRPTAYSGEAFATLFDEALGR